ncbi:probable cytochrome P450 6a13 [Euwallacea similis]|uniref:probable cytochrome P450 6a13 n=1 Tax=Euwallacea similis TaxID=1736056 RepID=UPI00344BCE50
MLLLLYFFLTVVGFVLYVKWVQTYWQRKGLPIVKYDFFFGHEKDLITNKISIGDTSLNIYREIKRLYPDTKHSGIYFFLRKIYLPLAPDLIKQILLKDFNYFLSHGTYHSPEDILSMNLFNLYGNDWRHLRVKLTPTFTSGKMKMMFDIFQDKTEGLIKSITPYLASNAGPVSIKEKLQRYTIEIISSCAFGMESKAMEEQDNDFATYGQKVTKSNVARFLLKETMPWKLLAQLGFRDFGRDTYKFFIRLVKENIKFRESNNVQRKDLMQLLMQLKEKYHIDSKEGLSENDIIAQCFLFFFAGFETSSTTMTFTLLLLAQHQDIQDKLRREIVEVLDKHQGKLSYEALMDMKYLEQVIHEALRLFPPVPILPRECTKDYQVPGTDMIVEKGTTVHVPIWGIHMDPIYYPNPEVFDPDRFSDENITKRPDFTFLPFGEGPRMCIGLRFGMLQTKLGITSLLRNFNFTLNKKTHLPIVMETGNILLAPKGNVWLDVHPTA